MNATGTKAAGTTTAPDTTATPRLAPGTRVKQGIIITFLPKNTDMPSDLLAKVASGRRMFDHDRSTFDRYLIEKEREKNGRTLRTCYYAPIAGPTERAHKGRA